MRLRIAILATLALASSAFARQPATTMPSTAPAISPATAPSAADWRRWIDRLDDRDPSARSAARETLMQLTRDELPAFADACRAASPLSPTQRSALREIVIQAYLAGRHGFRGIGPGYLGITIRNVVGTAQPPGGVVVEKRLLGYDAMRGLQVGDVITAVAASVGEDVQFEPVSRFDLLRTALSRCQPGDWVTARVLRDGAEQDVHIRLGPIPLSNPNLDPDGSKAAADYAEGENYWSQTFEPRLRGEAAPATKPAGSTRRRR